MPISKKYDAFFKKQQEELVQEQLPKYIERLSWSRSQIQELQLNRLKDILSLAKSNSSWHSSRLKDVDVSNFEISDLSKLPSMTKLDLMNNWDDIVTDHNLKLKMTDHAFDKREEHLVFLDKYHFWASGGSTGTRGLFVWSTDDYAHFAAGTLRQRVADMSSDEKSKDPLIKAVVVARDRIHMSNYLWGLKFIKNMQIHELSVSRSIKEIVESLNKIQPDHIECFSSVMVGLAHEQKAGRLNINPLRIGAICEPLFENERNIIEGVFKCPVINFYGSSEVGAHGINGDSGSSLMLSEDSVIVEPVDKDGNPVADGVESDKIFVTSLINKTMPLIRYEITDCVVREKGLYQDTNFRKIKSVTGRMDEGFVYNLDNNKEAVVNRLDFVDGFLKDSNISEYQVVQTSSGADISVETIGEVDIECVTNIIKDLLSRRGLLAPEVNIKVVEALPRHPQTGKLKRFISMSK